MSTETKSTTQDLLIALVLSIVLVYLSNLTIEYFVFEDFTKEITSKTEQLSGLSSENQRLVVMQANLNRLENNVDTLSNEYKELNNLIPEEKELPDILEYLYKSGLSRNLKISHFSQSQKIARVGALNQLPITVTVTGASDNISRYVNDFIRFKRILSVDSVEITKVVNQRLEISKDTQNTDPNSNQNNNQNNNQTSNKKVEEVYSGEIRFSAYLSDPKFDPKVIKN